MFSLTGWFDRLRSTYWFVPSLLTAAAIGLGVALIAVDAQYPRLIGGMSFVYAGGADGARSLLSAVAGSMITVVSVTFSVTVVAITVSSQHFGPRLLNSFMRDTAAQLVLGTFIGTFAYCVVVLRTVQGGSEGNAAFVPHLAVSVGVGLTLISVAMLIFYVHHVSSSLQVSEIANGVANDLERAIARLYPEPIGHPAPPMEVPERPVASTPVAAARSGYVQEVDPDRVLHWAKAHDAIVWLAVTPGDFAVEGMPVAFTTDRDGAGALADAFVIGKDRTMTQDAGFAIQQLVEVALHALSPGINEPFTAITCIDRLTQGLSTLAVRAVPSAGRVDDDGRVRVVARPRSFVDLLGDAFGPLRTQAAPHAAVVERLLRSLALLASRASRPEDCEAIRRELEAAHTAASTAIREPLDRERVDAAAAAAAAALARPVHDVRHG